MTVKLYDNDSDNFLGTITEAQRQFLIDQLEEETSDDQDYYLNPATIDMLERRDADPELITLLRTALGDKEGVEVRWKRGD